MSVLSALHRRSWEARRAIAQLWAGDAAAFEESPSDAEYEADQWTPRPPPAGPVVVNPALPNVPPAHAAPVNATRPRPRPVVSAPGPSESLPQLPATPSPASPRPRMQPVVELPRRDNPTANKRKRGPRVDADEVVDVDEVIDVDAPAEDRGEIRRPKKTPRLSPSELPVDAPGVSP